MKRSTGSLPRGESSRDRRSERAQRRAPKLGVIIETFDDGYSMPVALELMDAARERGMDALCFAAGLEQSDVDSGRPAVVTLPDAHSLDALVVVSLGNTVSSSACQAHAERYGPIPMSTFSVDWSGIPRAVVDNEPGMREGVRHLIQDHGRQRIAFVRGPDASSDAGLRYRVYREALAESGLEFDPRLVAPGWFIAQSGVDAIRLWLDERHVDFDAVVCVNDGTAIGVLQELAVRDIAVPEQVAVLGFDDIVESRYLDPPLTTIRQPIERQAREALDVALCRPGTSAQPETHVLPTELVVRESCGCRTYLIQTDAEPRDWEEEVTSRIQLELRGMPGAARECRISDTVLRALGERFVGDLSTDGDTFVRHLREVIQLVETSRGSVACLNHAVTLMAQSVARCVARSSPVASRAESRLHAARVMIGQASARQPARLQSFLRSTTASLLRLNQALASVRDVPSLSPVIAAALTDLGVASLFVCLYEPDGTSEARLIVAADAKREWILPSGGFRFPLREILPEAFLQHQHTTGYFITNLKPSDVAYEASALPPGYIVLERGPERGFTYLTVRDLVATALVRVTLLEQTVEQEMRVARRLKVGILPRQPSVPGLELCAVVAGPGSAGSDYYDTISTSNAGWLAIGRVGGGGLEGGLVLLMLQSTVRALVRRHPTALPSELIILACQMLDLNVHERMGRSVSMELGLLRYCSDGRLDVAGDHLVLALGHASGQVESLRGSFTCALRPGDLLVCHTDGSSQPAEGEQRLTVARTVHDVLSECRVRTPTALAEQLAAEATIAPVGDGPVATLIVAKPRSSSVWPGSTS